MRQDPCREAACPNDDQRKFVRAEQGDKKTAEPTRDETRSSLRRVSNSEVGGRILGPIVVADGGGIESERSAAKIKIVEMAYVVKTCESDHQT